jgi:hypothetical protein
MTEPPLTFEYARDKEQFLSALETCIDYYENKTSNQSQMIIFALNSVITWLLTLSTIYFAIPDLQQRLVAIIFTAPMAMIMIFICVVLLGLYFHNPSGKKLEKCYNVRIESQKWKIIIPKRNGLVDLNNADMKPIVPSENSNNTSGLIVGAIILIICYLLKRKPQ